MLYENVQKSAAYIKQQCDRVPETAVILGSGLGVIGESLENKVVIPYAQIPCFPVSTAPGHQGNLIIGDIGGKTVACLQGRIHYYEGMGMEAVAYPVYVLWAIGVKKLIVTNACGAMNETFKPGDLMLITDHINFMGYNPLIGPNDERFGPRFPDMSDAYAKDYAAKAKKIAEKNGLSYVEGVYAYFNGPCFETAAEIRAFKALGADVVGMSTVPETTVANYLGMKVLGIACITNMATGFRKEKHSAEEVLRIANESSDRMCLWIKKILEEGEQR